MSRFVWQLGDFSLHLSDKGLGTQTDMEEAKANLRDTIRFIPEGAGDPLPELPVDIIFSDADIEKSMRRWKKAMKATGNEDFAELLEAQVIHPTGTEGLKHLEGTVHDHDQSTHGQRDGGVAVKEPSLSDEYPAYDTYEELKKDRKNQPAYWISPDGRLIALNFHQSHISALKDNQEFFGIDLKSLEDSFGGETYISPKKLYRAALENGFIRVWRVSDYINIETAIVDNRTFRKLRKLATLGKIKVMTNDQRGFWEDRSQEKERKVYFSGEEFWSSERVVQIRPEDSTSFELKHLEGTVHEHDQSSHGNWAKYGSKIGRYKIVETVDQLKNKSGYFIMPDGRLVDISDAFHYGAIKEEPDFFGLENRDELNRDKVLNSAAKKGFIRIRVVGDETGIHSEKVDTTTLRKLRQLALAKKLRISKSGDNVWESATEKRAKFTWDEFWSAEKVVPIEETPWTWDFELKHLEGTEFEHDQESHGNWADVSATESDLPYALVKMGVSKVSSTSELGKEVPSWAWEGLGEGYFIMKDGTMIDLGNATHEEAINAAPEFFGLFEGDGWWGREKAIEKGVIRVRRGEKHGSGINIHTEKIDMRTLRKLREYALDGKIDIDKTKLNIWEGADSDRSIYFTWDDFWYAEKIAFGGTGKLELKHLPGEHDQEDHGNWARGKVSQVQTSEGRFNTRAEAEEWIDNNKDWGKIDFHKVEEIISDEDYIEIVETFAVMKDLGIPNLDSYLGYKYDNAWLRIHDKGRHGFFYPDYGTMHIGLTTFEQIQSKHIDRIEGYLRGDLSRLQVPGTWSNDTELYERLRVLKSKKGLREYHSMYYFPKNRSTEAAIRHEFGHYIHNHPKFRRDIDKYRSRIFKWNGGVTVRANDNWGECVAESFVLWSIGETDKMHPMMKTIFDSKFYNVSVKHLPGEHDQEDHGNWADGTVSGDASREYKFGVAGISDSLFRQLKKDLEWGKLRRDFMAEKFLMDEGATSGWESASNERRAEIKDEIVAKLSEDTGIPYEDVNRMIGQWATNSNGDRRITSIQEAAAEEFGLEMSEYQQKWAKIYRDQGETVIKDGMEAFGWSREKAEEQYPTQVPIADRATERKFVRAMYDNTQARFKELGFEPDDSILLYRGFGKTDKSEYDKYRLGSLMGYEGNVLESWSAGAGTADDFGRFVIAANVPIKNIASSCRTGFGCFMEGEFIVLGASLFENVMVVDAERSKEEHFEDMFAKMPDL